MLFMTFHEHLQTALHEVEVRDIPILELRSQITSLTCRLDEADAMATTSFDLRSQKSTLETRLHVGEDGATTVATLDRPKADHLH